MKNIADVTGGKPIAVLLQSISDVCAINPLDAFYDIHGGKREKIINEHPRKWYTAPSSDKLGKVCTIDGHRC
jgi:hypothetical protein